MNRVTKSSIRRPGNGPISRGPVRRPALKHPALKIDRAEESPSVSARAMAGARELWSALRLRAAKLLGPDLTAPTPMIRPSEVGVDRVLVGAVLVLVAFGMVMVFSSGAVFAAKKYGDAAYFLKREIVYALLGLGAMSLAVRIDYGVFRRFAYPLLFVSIMFLAAVLKIGSRAGGAIRWFRLGPLSFQPSELAKLALCVYLASLLARKAEKVRVFSVGFLPPLLVTGLMMGLLLKQPDLGTAVIFGCVALGLLFIAGTRSSYLILAVLVAAPAGWKFIVSTPFRMRRMLAFLDPWAFRRDVGYQITESLISVGSGGVTGLGLGDGRQKLFFLPRGPHRLHPLHRRRGTGAHRRPLRDRRLRAAGLARPASGHARARRVRRLPGVRDHGDVRAAGAGEHRRRARVAADEGAAAAVHQLRWDVVGDEPLHGGRAGQHQRAQPRAA